MTITVALAAVAVLGAIVVVAVGGGGQLSTEHPDHPPLALPGRRAVGGTDAALLRLPLGLWGYHKQITDEALQRFAYELTERDTRIAVLEQELAEARRGHDGDTRPDLRPDRRGDRPAAILPARDDAPDPMVTRTDFRPEVSGSRPEPLATRVDVPAERSTPNGDPWQTIVDRPGDADDAAAQEAGAAEERPADERPAEPAAEEPADEAIEASGERADESAQSAEHAGPTESLEPADPAEAAGRVERKDDGE